MKISCPYGARRLSARVGHGTSTVARSNVDRTRFVAFAITSPPVTLISVPVGVTPVWNVVHTRARNTAVCEDRNVVRNFEETARIRARSHRPANSHDL
jgi:hypothetical protein